MISHDVSEYMITKEEISLKELDFKLRKQLIENIIFTVTWVQEQSLLK